MGRRWESDDDAVDAALRILVVTYSLERMIQTVRGSAMELMRRVNHPTQSAVSGLPCAGEFQWNAQPETRTHEVAPAPDGMALHDDPPSRPA